MANGWQKITLLLIAVGIGLLTAWTGAVSDEGDKRAAKIAVLEENVRNIHHEQSIDRGILNRIDKNTGGDGDAPPVRPLREVK